MCVCVSVCVGIHVCVCVCVFAFGGGWSGSHIHLALHSLHHEVEKLERLYKKSEMVCLLLPKSLLFWLLIPPCDSSVLNFGTGKATNVTIGVFLVYAFQPRDSCTFSWAPACNHASFPTFLFSSGLSGCFHVLVAFNPASLLLFLLGNACLLVSILFCCFL